MPVTYLPYINTEISGDYHGIWPGHFRDKALIEVQEG